MVRFELFKTNLENQINTFQKHAIRNAFYPLRHFGAANRQHVDQKKKKLNICTQFPLSLLGLLKTTNEIFGGTANSFIFIYSYSTCGDSSTHTYVGIFFFFFQTLVPMEIGKNPRGILPKRRMICRNPKSCVCRVCR